MFLTRWQKVRRKADIHRDSNEAAPSGAASYVKARTARIHRGPGLLRRAEPCTDDPDRQSVIRSMANETPGAQWARLASH